MKILIIEDENKVTVFLRKGFAAEACSAEIAADGTFVGNEPKPGCEPPRFRRFANPARG